MQSLSLEFHFSKQMTWIWLYTTKVFAIRIEGGKIQFLKWNRRKIMPPTYELPRTSAIRRTIFVLDETPYQKWKFSRYIFSRFSLFNINVRT